MIYGLWKLLFDTLFHFHDIFSIFRFFFLIFFFSSLTRMFFRDETLRVHSWFMVTVNVSIISFIVIFKFRPFEKWLFFVCFVKYVQRNMSGLALEHNNKISTISIDAVLIIFVLIKKTNFNYFPVSGLPWKRNKNNLHNKPNLLSIKVKKKTSIVIVFQKLNAYCDRGETQRSKTSVFWSYNLSKTKFQIIRYSVWNYSIILCWNMLKNIHWVNGIPPVFRRLRIGEFDVIVEKW